MPDFERLTDDLREYLAVGDPVELAYQRGVARGKTKARLQVAFVAFVVAAIWLLASA